MGTVSEIFNINNFIGEPAWDENADPAPYFELGVGEYEVGGIHYIQMDSGYNSEENEPNNENNDI